MNATAGKPMKSPLEALQERVARQGSDVAMIQPVGGGTLREYTWEELNDEARRVATYLKSLDFPAGSNIALMSKNCAEWMIADWAIWMAGHVSVPLYPTLTADSVRQILEHSESKLLFVGKLDVWEEARTGVREGLPQVAFSLAPDDARRDFITWEDIVAKHEPLADVANPASSDLATIIYTSGTTGTPKGVMHSFGSLAVMGEKMPEVYNLSSKDRVISYLPLSHVAERAAVELATLYVGVRVFFAESLDTFAEDIKRARPTVFFAVPRIWTKFYQKASEAVPPAKLKKLLKVPLLNRVIKKKVLSAMGLHECRYALSGASALSPEVIVWFRSLGLEILEVYGMTENMAWSHTTREGDQRIGWVGKPNDGVEQRIAENGEILVRSVANMQGYFKDEAKTKEDLTDDGWLHTGDVGEIDSEGRLRITGRVKEIFKTAKGKYVAPAPIENRLVSHPGIDQACVMGADMPQPVALLCLSPEETDRLADESARAAYLEGLSALLSRVNGEIDAHERLDALVVVAETWGVENNLLTPTLKLKRNELEKVYCDRLPGWAAKRGVVWAR